MAREERNEIQRQVYEAMLEGERAIKACDMQAVNYQFGKASGLLAVVEILYGVEIKTGMEETVKSQIRFLKGNGGL